MLFKKSWRFKLEEDFEHTSVLLLGIEFENRFVTIRDSGIIIRKEYAWDGCSPAYKLSLGKHLPQGLWFGTWDGPLNTNAKAVTHRAALVHDVLCQFRKDINITKLASVNIFKQLLIEDGAPYWMVGIYPIVVSLFGPQNWKH